MTLFVPSVHSSLIWNGSVCPWLARPGHLLSKITGQLFCGMSLVLAYLWFLPD